jgi:AcrR family transcriptional regulator
MHPNATTVVESRVRAAVGRREVDYGRPLVNSGPVSADGPRPYRSGLRAEQARLTRSRVLEGATAVFLEHGFSGATMRAIAARAGVSLPAVELLFGTKGRLLKAAIDVAIAGDDEPVPMLAREWTATASRAATAREFLGVVAGVLGPAQQRSAGLVLALFEAAASDPALAELATQRFRQRAVMAGWIVDQVIRTTPLGPGRTRREAVDTVWLLLDPAVFDRLTRRLGWSLRRYQRWFATSVDRLLIGDSVPT